MAFVNYPKFQEESLQFGQKHSIIRVKNLSANARVGVDVWGRTEVGKVIDKTGESKDVLKYNKLQPVQVSVSMALKEPFETAASSDSVDGSTVHYGELSKQILKVLAYRGENFRPCGEAEEAYWVKRCTQQDWTLTTLLDAISSWLMGQPFSGNFDVKFKSKYGICFEVEHRLLREAGKCKCSTKPMDMDRIHELELSCFLPKGSILGTGVSLRALTMPYSQTPGKSVTFCSILKLHDIHIPTLIGVNANERQAKQMVIANVEIDGYLLYDVDLYHNLEQIVVKTIEESSFETLETLGSHLVKRIIKWFIYSEYNSFKTYEPSYSPHTTEDLKPKPRFEQLVTVSLEKPSAVMFAESPVVELRRHADPDVDKTGSSKQLMKEIWSTAERTGKHGDYGTKVPFPLQGRLDEWIRLTDPDDTT